MQGSDFCSQILMLGLEKALFLLESELVLKPGIRGVRNKTLVN